MGTDSSDGRLAHGTATETVEFDAASLTRVRRAVVARATGEGLGRGPTSDLALAVHELAANAVRHGGGGGVLRVWGGDGSVHCEVEDHGRPLDDPDAGRGRPETDAPSGRGLWLVRQLCDDVDITRTPGGTTVRVHMHVCA